MGEPIAGSAVERTWRWLGIAYPRRWEARAVEAADLGPLREWVDAFEARPGTRVQLVRTEVDTPIGWFADTAERRVHRFDLADPPAVDALLEGSAPGRTDETLVWVCTNGRRDACCARFGSRLYHALRERLGDAVWQTTHLGGHRFAATLLVLPEGLCYGRLDIEHADALAGAIRAGRPYDVAYLRGRVAWSRPAQAAEARVLAAGARTVVLVEETRDGDLTHVHLEVDGTPQVVTVEPIHLPAFKASCDKPPASRTALRAR